VDLQETTGAISDCGDGVRDKEGTKCGREGEREKWRGKEGDKARERGDKVARGTSGMQDAGARMRALAHG
jgi:hypothetical protein